MFNSLLLFIVKLVLFPITIAIDIISLPIQHFFNFAIPNSTEYMSQVNQFIELFIVRGTGFAREVFLNVTHFPRPLFYFFVSFFAFRVGLHGFILFIKFLINVYYLIRGAHLKSSAKSNKGV